MKKAKVLSIIGILAIITTFSGCSSGGSNLTDTLSETTAETTIQGTVDTPKIETTSSDFDFPDDTISDNANVDVENAEKNISVKAVPTEDNQLCVFITNNNSFVVDDLEIEAVFYDKKGAPVGTDSDGHDMILPGATVVSGLHLPNNYEKFETNVTVELGVNSTYKNHSDKVELTQNMTANGAIVQIKNNDTETIEEVELKAVFYNSDRIVSVSYDEDISDLRSGQTETIEITCLKNFDKVEIYLNQAHTFGL